MNITRLLPLLGLGLCLIALSCGRKEQARPGSPLAAQRPTLTFYSIEECFLCQKLRPRLEDLKRKWDRRMVFQEYDQHLTLSQDRVAKLGLAHHGIVITDHAGKALWKLDLHRDDDAVMEAEVAKLLEPKPPAQP